MNATIINAGARLGP
ncbi:hypothetical protein S7711_10059 [Stachybotrys chartarum IBT 7711]|uniref:Uncharacterized protein n=1 Tax=Stachybotrys chartarum (strain CBS 109288 / IBT 7711) TaxID=1280523 RepID=A0A084B2Q0_STACB|nr:hypothetical protein S7711_10059 [Stachybotrys chartarum IBT 7711]